MAGLPQTIALLLGMLIAVSIGVAARHPSGAQEATPAPFPVTPSPRDCRIEPRPIGFFEQFLATAPATPATPPATTTARFVPPQGVPADSATVRAIEATVHEFFACLHAGDVQRYWALYSEGFITARFAASPPTEEALRFLEREPVPMPPNQRITIHSVRDVTVHADGSVGAYVEYDYPGVAPRANDLDFFFFVHEGGRYRIDAVVENLEVISNEETGTPET